MSNFKIIRDPAEINKRLNSQKKRGPAWYNFLHENAIMVLVHANEHGQCKPLNRFYAMLQPNEQTAFKNYVRLFQTKTDDEGYIVKGNDGKPLMTDYYFLQFKSGEWAIDTNVPLDRRKPGSPFVKHAENVLLNPDGEKAKPFYQRENLKDMALFGDSNVVTTLKSLASKANGENERVVSQTSPKMQAFLTEMLNKAQSLADETEKRKQPAEVKGKVEKPKTEISKAGRKANAKAKSQMEDSNKHAADQEKTEATAA